ncbi:uncharacterized protein LOC134534716 [Bacillus rossius redtenbacheri]|uniref:uncharacterized protein LOC134534716 n=1 Tax=Bacillus rossius redtenbacheri TaxID=93214 RepID=UPI002FDD75F6
MRLGTITALLTMLWVRHGPDEASAVQPGFLDFDNLPDTNFSCENKVIGGYYADVETGCQMFHVCTIGQKGEITDIKFLCLNGTVFDQETRVCERVDEVDCNKTLSFYDLNLELYGNSPPLSISEEESTEANYHDDLSREATSSPLTTTPPSTTTTIIATTTTTTTSRPFFFTTPSREQFLPTIHSHDEDHPYGIHSLHSYQPPRVNVDKPGQSGFLPASTPGHQDDPQIRHQQFLNNRFTSTTHSPAHLFNIHNHGPSGFSITSTSQPQSFNANPFPGRDSSQEFHRPFPSISPGFINHQLSQPSPSSSTTTKRPPFSISQSLNRQSPIVHAAHNLRTKISNSGDGFKGHHGINFHSQNPLNINFNSHQQGHQLLATPSVAVVATTISTSKSMNSKGFFFKPQAGGTATNYSDHFRLSPLVSVNLTVSSPQLTETSSLPSSYDEYQEHDVHTDPFFRDVPRVSSARSNTAAQQGYERQKRGTDTIKKTDKTLMKTKKLGYHLKRVNPNSDEDNSYGKDSRHQEHVHKKNKEAAWVPEDLENMARRISEVTRSRVFNYHVASVSSNGNEYRRPSVANSGKHVRPKCSKSVGREKCASPTRRDSSHRRSARQVNSGYYSGDTLPTTSFTCKDKVPGGYYADVETDCQLFHICSQGRHGRLTDNKFWCGPGTRFNQLSRTCQAAELVDCGLAASLFHLNDHFLPEQLDPATRDVIMFEPHKEIHK